MKVNVENPMEVVSDALQPHQGPDNVIMNQSIECVPVVACLPRPGHRHRGTVKAIFVRKQEWSRALT